MPEVSGMHCYAVSRSGEVQPFLGNETFLSNDLDSVGVTWDRIDNDIIGDYYFQIGTKEGLSDVIPNTLAVFNDSGTIWIGDPYMYISSIPNYNISDLKFLNDECAERICNDVVKTENDFHMEPGRTLFSQIAVCTVGHHCEVAKVIKTIFFRQNDVIADSTITSVRLENGNNNVVVNLNLDSGKYKIVTIM
ncbi:uncharacterized protein [Ptychodera flava]|uniref:uncharacterized protein n=1 Tax=Ptychodera flava TaxID=63121 RepID=UPI003969CE7B